MTREEKELVLPPRTVEMPPTVEGPEPRPTVVGHAAPLPSGKIDPRVSGISPSKVFPEPRKLNPGIGYDPVTQTVISEQEYIERHERQEALERRCAEIETRRRRWEGKSDEGILLEEIDLFRPGTLEDPTWSLYATKDGYQAHLYGVTESVTPNQLEYARRSSGWHILGRGIIERLRRKRARQMDVEQTPRPEVYEEQVRLLSDLVKLSGGELYLEEVERTTAGIREPATKAKTQVHYLVRFLGAIIREGKACQKVTAEEGAPASAASRSQGQGEEVELLRAEVEYLQAQLRKVRAAMGSEEA